MYEIDSVRKGYAYNPFSPNKLELAQWGWVIEGKINSKNRMGGYTGWQPFYAIYNHGMIIKDCLNCASPENSGPNPVYFP